MRPYFADSCAAVTGGASGLGLGLARRLLCYGARAVFLADRNAHALEAAAEQLDREYPGRVFSQVTDVTDSAQVEALVQRAAAQGGLDFMFNNAGRPMTKPTETMDAQEFTQLAQVNYLGTAYGVLSALKVMLPRGRGHIVNTASMGGLVPAPFQAAYASTKAAVITMTRSLAYEYADTGLRFSQISPANVATPIFKAELAESLRRQGKTEEEIDALTANIAPPPGAMSLDAALDIIFDGIEAGKTDIICWDQGEGDPAALYYTDRPQFDAYLLGMARQRRAYYDECAQRKAEQGENAVLPPFPG